MMERYSRMNPTFLVSAFLLANIGKLIAAALSFFYHIQVTAHMHYTAAEIWPFEIFKIERSVVGRWSVGRQYNTSYADFIYSSSL